MIKRITTSILSSIFVFTGAYASDNKNYLCFFENAAQITDQYYQPRTDIDFKLQAGEVSVFIGDGQLHYQWQKNRNIVIPGLHRGKFSDPAPVIIDYYRMDIILEGANKSAKVIREQQLDGVDVFYTTGIEQGALAHSYQKITYQNIYPGIDWVLYAQGNTLKYDFVVHPGGNPDDIRLRFEGSTSLALADGNLQAGTPYGSLTEKKPYSYDAETGKEISSAFILNGNILSFKTGACSNTLVIDPTIAWSTYYGGNNDDYGVDIVPDNNGNVYVAGYTISTSSNMATTGAFQTSASAGYDGFIAKYTSKGQRIWGTYFGGTGDEYIRAIALDKNGDLYVTGKCTNTTIMTAGAHQTNYGGGTSDAFLAKFSGTGQRLWATYYGGTGEDIGNSVTCDTNGCVYIAGFTTSINNISTVGAHQTINGGSQDCFLTKFYPNGQRHWATYYGGSNTEYNTYVNCSKNNNVYICGTTYSINNIASGPGVFQSQLANNGDAFYARFDTTGQRLYGTYYGGNSGESTYAITTDKNENIYITGTSGSTDTIASTGSYQTTLNGPSDCFIVKFNNQDQKLWGTYYGGNNTESPWGISCDAVGNLYVIGTTGSMTNIASPNAYKGVPTNPNDLDDAFIAIFDPAGQRTYGSYFGGEHDEYGCRGTCDASGNIYFTGLTTSTTAIITPGCYQPTLQSTADAFITKFTPDNTITTGVAPTSLCPNAGLNLSYTVTGTFQPGNIFTVFLSDASGNFYNAVAIGSIAATSSGSITCTIPTGTPAGTGYRVRIVSSNPYFVADDNGSNISIQYLIPTVLINASPNNSVGPGRTINFNASVTSGGATPTFQWKKNGVAIPGATNAMYSGITGIDFTTGDKISVDVISNDNCANPANASSAEITVNIDLGIADITRNGIGLYPNPAKNVLVLTGCEPGKSYQYSIINSMGVAIQKGELNENRTITLPAHAAPGIYHLQIKSDNSEIHVRFDVS